MVDLRRAYFLAEFLAAIHATPILLWHQFFPYLFSIESRSFRRLHLFLMKVEVVRLSHRVIVEAFSLALPPLNLADIAHIKLHGLALHG